MGRFDVKDNMLAREQVANVKKHWVRLVTACNSRCLFCLDTDTPRNVYIPVEDVQRELIRGREQLHADKVILSGGEGSLHPNFVDFVGFARDLGYTRIQTVTNGVMFAKRDFYRAAVDAGLGEITFSLHGHTPELHDYLTGTPGAFHKLMKGMVRARREGKIIVNVDVCINKQNVPYIDKIVELCLSVGVAEFDLLHVIPQGVAFENRDELFYDPVEHLPRLQKVFRLNRHPNVVVWTNRFPIEFLEGLEDLIQDPHKMLDEVNGRRFQVRRYLDEGTPLECRQKERCQHCFIEPFCNSADRVIERQNRAAWDVWWIGDPAHEPNVAVLDVPASALPYGASYVGGDIAELSELEAIKSDPGRGVFVRPEAISAPVAWERLPRPLIVAVDAAPALDALAAGESLPAGVQLEIRLNRGTAPWLLQHKAWLSSNIEQIRLHQPSYEFMKDAVDNDVRSPKSFFLELALPVKVSGLTACMAPGTRLVESPRILERTMFDTSTGRLNIRELARHHVIHGYFGKSLRCRECPVTERCEGAHINFLRDQGFAQLEPLGDSPWATEAAAQLLKLRPQPPLGLRDGRAPEAVAPSLPGCGAPEPAPIEPLIVLGQKVKEDRERRRMGFQPAAAPPA